ncbi:MAG: hypothetical protein HY698_20680 [Deltaproteobacteria bacterium]|nr:hypothetical protein [Deltaproteobacteria bacterium]
MRRRLLGVFLFVTGIIGAVWLTTRAGHSGGEDSSSNVRAVNRGEVGDSQGVQASSNSQAIRKLHRIGSSPVRKVVLSSTDRFDDESDQDYSLRLTCLRMVREFLDDAGLTPDQGRTFFSLMRDGQEQLAEASDATRSQAISEPSIRRQAQENVDAELRQELEKVLTERQMQLLLIKFNKLYIPLSIDNVFIEG